jgi:iron complex outermembrane receptor protein
LPHLREYGRSRECATRKEIVDVRAQPRALTSDLQVTRYGRVPNAAQTAYITPTSLANLSTRYQFSSNGSVGVIVNNVLDTIKEDASFGWPFYPVGNYTPYGRQYWLSLDYHFGK